MGFAQALCIIVLLWYAPHFATSRNWRSLRGAGGTAAGVQQQGQQRAQAPANPPGPHLPPPQQVPQPQAPANPAGPNLPPPQQVPQPQAPENPPGSNLPPEPNHG